ncbi:MAG: glucose-6-phosphate isomerase, partial [Verrucomicrobiales bacterium]
MNWSRFKTHSYHYADLGISLDLSRLPFPDDFLSSKEAAVQEAFSAMADENRMVGHYWLRTPSLAPSPELRSEILDTLARIVDFAARVHSGEISGPKGKFKNLLVIGIGGSALGPQFVAHALGQPRKDKLAVSFFDNTDPDGIDRVIAQIGDELATTLTLVISKSGGTKETRNGMLEAEAAYKKAGLDFAKHVVAVTGDGSELDKHAKAQGWLAGFPMWDWVGGRTSIMSAVG